MKALQLLGRISAFVAAFVALFIVLTGPFVIILTEKNAALETIADVTGALAVVLASWLCARRLDHRRLDEIGFSLRALIPLIFGGILLGAAMSAGALVALGIEHGWLIGEGVRITNPLLAAITVGGMAFNIVLQEGLVRGYAFDIARRTFGAGSAILVSTVLFVGMHSAIYLGGPDVPFIAANLALAGLALGLAVLWTGSIWFGVGAHYAWNMIESLAYGRSSGVALFAGFDGRWIHLAPSSVESSFAGLAGPALGLAALCAWRLLHGPRKLKAQRV